MNLVELYDTLDAATVDKWIGYLEFYEHWFSPLRGRAPRILEIGVENGGSLNLWREYFGPGAEIVGVDINPACLEHAGMQIKVEIGDQGDKMFLTRIAERHGPFDIVIDDGSHFAAHQLLSWSILYPVTSKFYCVEDTHTAYWPAFKMREFPFDFIEFAKFQIDVLHQCFIQAGHPEIYSDDQWRKAIGEQNPNRARLKGIHFYDSLVIMEAGHNPLPQRRARPQAQTAPVPSAPRR